MLLFGSEKETFYLAASTSRLPNIHTKFHYDVILQFSVSTFRLHFVLIVRIFQSKIKRFTRFLRVANYFIVFRGRDVFPTVQLRFLI